MLHFKITDHYGSLSLGIHSFTKLGYGLFPKLIQGLISISSHRSVHSKCPIYPEPGGGGEGRLLYKRGGDAIRLT